MGASRRSTGAAVGKQTDLGEAGAEFIVEVAGEARAFGFQEVLAFGVCAGEELFD